MSEKKLPNQVYRLRQSDFYAIPSKPWVYWAPPLIRSLFLSSTPMGEIAPSIHGTGTYDNFRFLRFWWEAGTRNILFGGKNWLEFENSKKNYVPYMKGGKFKRWYGNQEYILQLLFNGGILNEFLNEKRDSIRGKDKIFNVGITYSFLTSGNFSARISPGGFIFDVAGSSLFPNNVLLYLAILNSSFSNYILKLVNPTVNFQVGDLARIPVPKKSSPTLESLVLFSLQQSKLVSSSDETTYDFIFPHWWKNNNKDIQNVQENITKIESSIDDEVYKIYGISSEDRNRLEADFSANALITEEPLLDGSNILEDEDDSRNVLTINELSIAWLSYAIGIILGRFQPGTTGSLGSAINYRTDFAIGSLPEPTEEEFNELVGDPSQFAYVNEQGGRHVFTRPVEQALQKLALPDGIAVFDPNHPRDLPTLVSKALELMLGQDQAQEVIQQAAGGDLRKFLEKDFFTQHHIKQYRKRPVYWPIQSSKRSYGFVLFHEKIDRNTFYALQQEPYLPTKRRAVQLRLEELGKKVLTAQGAARKPIEKEMDELRQLAEELAQFAKDLDAITRGGYEPEADWIDDGVILRMAPLWSVIPLWKSEPKKYWEELAAGKYDWSRIAMKYWPERVKQVCKKNKSYAIAHGHEEWYKGG
jgi:hypothetical protein